MAKIDKITQEKTQLIPVHVSAKEIIYMNSMQKSAMPKETDERGQIIDPQSGLRAYPGLSVIIENPETKRLFIGALHAIKTKAQMPPEIQQAFNHNNAELKKQPFPSIASDHAPGVKKMANTGEGNDKFLVMMPLDVVNFLESIEGTKRRDPKLGLDEFAFFDDIFEGVGVALHSAKQREPHFWGALAGAASLGVGAWLGNQADEEEQEQYQKELQAEHTRRQGVADRWNKGGLQIAAFSPKPLDKYSQHGLKKPAGERFKKGGLVLGRPLKGKGHGQEDLINMDIPEKTWIWDAHTVANFGNGSSEAGQKEIERLEKFAAHKLKKIPGLKETIHAELKPKSLRIVKCAVANDERRTNPIAIAALGHGSNDLGSKVTREMTEDLRHLKTSNGKALPPAAPDIIQLYKRAAHKFGMEV